MIFRKRIFQEDLKGSLIEVLSRSLETTGSLEWEAGPWREAVSSQNHILLMTVNSW